ncbi:hypothetical protein [Pseudovibrio sp. Alg231-02]|uniref:hypothetical protein n=1 Tax=Pseudovibrio sp. Alg231-02 TaxID=1922223 RepID=UPI000D55AD16|nr:hypothetical protein [Pseudovibrio sp. Alg231-02]
MSLGDLSARISAILLLKAMLSVSKQAYEATWSSEIEAQLPDVDALASALQASPHAKELIDQGVLFVFLVKRPNFGLTTDYKAALAVEGVGSDPVQARLNFLAGDTGISHDLSQHMKEAIGLQVSASGESLASDQFLRKGFFIKRDPESGQFQTQDALNMSQIDKDAALKYAAFAHIVSSKMTLAKLFSLDETQSYFEQLQEQFTEVAKAKAVADKLLESLAFRKKAILALNEAEKHHKDAARWSRVAKGWSMVSGLMSLVHGGYSAYSSAQKQAALKETLDQLTTAQEDLRQSEINMNAKIEEVNKRTNSVNYYFQLIVPNVPLPKTHLDRVPFG